MEVQFNLCDVFCMSFCNFMNKFIIILFKERGNGILQRDVEFSLTLFETCELVPPTILKVCK